MFRSFEETHEAFIREHLDKRDGERRGRLERGHGHAERLFLRNVWWPLRKSFDALHPEYEVLDWRGRPFFADFAWLPGYVKLIIEIKGYDAHVRRMDRQNYCNELNRETFLFAMGYLVISFAYDDVAHRPELCITLLRMALARFEASASSALGTPDTLMERENVKLAIRMAQPIRPKDVAEHLRMDAKTALKWLGRCREKGWLRPVYRGEGKRILRYDLACDPISILGG
ncbi:hypothetical protein MO973_06840 [Paenibacillus sp. TRM 82003]|nr:hypothetical protein [Paenibacillus sp. TRM 82003]